MLSPERRVLSHSWKRVASAEVQLFESSTAKTAVTKRRVAVVSRCTSTVRAKLSERTAGKSTASSGRMASATSSHRV